MSTILQGRTNETPVFTKALREFGCAHAFATIVDSGVDGDYYMPDDFPSQDGSGHDPGNGHRGDECLGAWLNVTISGG